MTLPTPDEFKKILSGWASMCRNTPRYTVRMLGVCTPSLDINGVCRKVRDSLKIGIIPVIEIDTDHEVEDEDEEMST